MTAVEELKKIIAEMESDRAAANEKMNNKEYGQNLVSYFGGRNDVLDKYIYKLEQITTPQPPPMTNKTAIAQLIEQIEKYRNSEREKHLGPSGLNYVINTARELLAIERQQQVDFGKWLSKSGWTPYHLNMWEHPSDEIASTETLYESYYEQTFGNSQNIQQ